MSAETTYDIIFAGGGTTGCLIAGRLAAADPSLKILILEAGEHTLNLAAHIQPIRYLTHIAPASTTVTHHVSKPNKHLGGRQMVVQSGRCLGGGSSVNLMVYTRAAASDYDDWENVFGNPGWGSKDLIPLLKKTETYQINTGQAMHGYSGPLKVSYGGASSNVGKQFLEAAALYDKDRVSTGDPSDPRSCDVYGQCPKWIDEETGRRSDVAHNFIYNQHRNQNLEVVTGHRVKRVLFESDRAVGVEYVKDTTLDPAADQTSKSARASRLVIVSAGAFGSPTILERSGIGRIDVLESIGIKPRVDLPGVGESYQDHNVIFPTFAASDEADTLDAIFRGEKEIEDTQMKLWNAEGKGLIATNGVDAAIRLRPNTKDLKTLGPGFEARWGTFYSDAPDKPAAIVGVLSGYLGGPSNDPARQYFTAACYSQYPVSLGSVHITSANDINAPHNLDLGFLSDSSDMVILRWAYKMARERCRRLSIYRGEHIPGHPVFPEGSAATCSDQVSGPVDVSAPDIVYTAEDDQAIDEYIKEHVQSAWHSLGTCAMKPREEGGVLDYRLNVYGVKGLKVADLSIAPQNVSANTYSTALVIGEKAAVIIAEELGIHGV